MTAAGAWYNEVDPYAAQWLRNLIAAGEIAPGVVDERSIEDVHPEELFQYTQCHFFAGIGVWSLSLRRAGWPDDRPVWTGSCPCQPFSAAGKGAGVDDERHLWPAWFWLINICKPPRIYGEQVASKDGLGWLDLVHADLEASGYAVGAVDSCAAGVGAPHIRQRLYIVADTMQSGRAERWTGAGARSVAGSGGFGLVVDADHEGLEGRRGMPERASQLLAGPSGVVGGLADALHTERGSLGVDREDGRDRSDSGREEAHGVAGTRGEVHSQRPGPVNGFWGPADWLFCRDGKWRPVIPGSFPLAHGVANRVGKLRAYGNAIVAPQAEEFIRASLDVLG